MISNKINKVEIKIDDEQFQSEKKTGMDWIYRDLFSSVISRSRRIYHKHLIYDKLINIDLLKCNMKGNHK